MTKLFQLGQHIRHDRNVWYSLLCGVPVTDPNEIEHLEAEYRARQSQQRGTGPRPPMGVHLAGHTPVVRSKGRMTNRESRKGRVE